MNILFLDDNPQRHVTIQPHLLNYDKAFDVKDAKEWLSKKSYDLVFLDHDLGGQEMVSSEEEETGMTVAKFIVENKIPIKFVVVHSLNWDGARNMHRLLHENGYHVQRIQFTMLVKEVGEVIKFVKDFLN